MVNDTPPSLGWVPVKWLATEHVDGGLETHNARHWGVVVAYRQTRTEAKYLMFLSTSCAIPSSGRRARQVVERIDPLLTRYERSDRWQNNHC